MSIYPTDPSEQIRNKLNSLPEKDNRGNYNRLRWQTFTYFIGSALEESTNPKLKNLGKSMRIGAKKSFVDYLTQKIVGWLDKLLDKKVCSYCGYANNSNAIFCNQCRNYFY